MVDLKNILKVLNMFEITNFKKILKFSFQNILPYR